MAEIDKNVCTAYVYNEKTVLLRGVHKGAQLKVVINPIYIFDAISIKIPVKFQNSIFFSFTEIDNPEMFIEK